MRNAVAHSWRRRVLRAAILPFYIIAVVVIGVLAIATLPLWLIFHRESREEFIADTLAPTMAEWRAFLSQIHRRRR